MDRATYVRPLHCSCMQDCKCEHLQIPLHLTVRLAVGSSKEHCWMHWLHQTWVQAVAVCEMIAQLVPHLSAVAGFMWKGPTRRVSSVAEELSMRAVNSVAADTARPGRSRCMSLRGYL